MLSKDLSYIARLKKAWSQACAVIKDFTMVEVGQLVGTVSEWFHHALGADDNGPERLQLLASLGAPECRGITILSTVEVDTISDALN